MPLPPGAHVDRYTVLDLLGSGGMGEVYRARDPKLERQVALKVLRIDKGPETDGGARLVREARALAALSHPNVVVVYDVGEVKEPEELRGTTYVAMELVVGPSLRKHIGRATVTIEQRLAWMKDVARALSAAHGAGIVHRDVKPENVMVSVDGTIKVLDFGIARRTAVVPQGASTHEGHSLSTMPTQDTGVAGMTTASGLSAGTPYYMAPEQLRAERVDTRTDQFAWGVTAYELLTGKGPWANRGDALALALEVLSTEPAPAHELEPSVPPSVSKTIARAMRKAPADRFASMSELLAAIEGAGVEETDAFADTSPAAPRLADARSGARWPRWAVAFGAAGALAAAGAVGGMLARSGARATRPEGDASVPAPAALSADACTSNAACSRAHGGGAWRCHSQRHTCVPLESAECKVYAAPSDAQREDTIWFGGMFPLSTDPEFLPEMRATELAREDFVEALGSSADRPGDLHARSIGLVICDEGRDGTAAARHLVHDVEAPAVIGFSGADTIYPTIPSILLPAHTLSMISIAQSASVTKIPEPSDQPRLIWRTTLDSADQDGPWAALVSDYLEPRARAGPGGLGDRPLHFALVRGANSAGDDTDIVFRTLRFNGKTALENGDAYRQFTVDMSSKASLAQTAEALRQFAPEVIFAPYGYPPLVKALEAAWGPGRRPSYIVGSELDPRILDFLGTDASRRRRFFAVTNVSTTMTNAELVMRYDRAFPATPVERTNAPQPSYDAFYVLAYAAYAIGASDVTGPALSRAIGRLLPPGRRVDVGPRGIYDAFATLRSGGKIDLNGAIGALDFDPATGEAPVDYAILCCAVDDHGRASSMVESGLVYDAKLGKLTGRAHCP